MGLISISAVTALVGAGRRRHGHARLSAPPHVPCARARASYAVAVNTRHGVLVPDRAVDRTTILARRPHALPLAGLLEISLLVRPTATLVVYASGLRLSPVAVSLTSVHVRLEASARLSRDVGRPRLASVAAIADVSAALRWACADGP